jgi:hypothetical protein
MFFKTKSPYGDVVRGDYARFFEDFLAAFFEDFLAAFFAFFFIAIKMLVKKLFLYKNSCL